MACLKDEMRLCIRCKGRKTLYKLGGGYTFTNMGGKEVKCPMCLGEGKIKSMDALVKASKKKALKKEIQDDQREKI